MSISIIEDQIKTTKKVGGERNKCWITEWNVIKRKFKGWKDWWESWKRKKGYLKKMRGVLLKIYSIMKISVDKWILKLIQLERRWMKKIVKLWRPQSCPVLSLSVEYSANPNPIHSSCHPIKNHQIVSHLLNCHGSYSLKFKSLI